MVVCLIIECTKRLLLLLTRRALYERRCIDRERKRERIDRYMQHVWICLLFNTAWKEGNPTQLPRSSSLSLSLYVSIIFPSCQLTCRSDTHIRTHTTTARAYLCLRTSRRECRACARIPRRCGECARCVVYVCFLTCINLNLIFMHRSSSPCKRQFQSFPPVLLSSLLVCVPCFRRMIAKARATASSLCRGHIF